MSLSGGSVSASGNGAEQKEKRTHTEVVDSSMCDEFASIQKQLDQMSTDINQTREDLKNLMSKLEMRDCISKPVEKITKTMKEQLEIKFKTQIENEVTKKVDEELDEKIKDKMQEMTDRMDILTLGNVNMREEIYKSKTEITENGSIAKDEMQKANMNEHYSRKNNIKIMGVPEDGDENENRLTNNVKQILEQKAGVLLEESKIVAIHCIPGKIGMLKPVLLKLTNNNKKAKIMRKRKEMKLGAKSWQMM